MTPTPDDYRGALEAVERILNRGGDADDVLRRVVDAVAERLTHYSWIGLSFVEQDELVLGPSRGTRDRAVRLEAPVSFQGREVALLEVETTVPEAGDPDLLGRVATLISAYCLVAEGPSSR